MDYVSDFDNSVNCIDANFENFSHDFHSLTDVSSCDPQLPEEAVVPPAIVATAPAVYDVVQDIPPHVRLAANHAVQIGVPAMREATSTVATTLAPLRRLDLQVLTGILRAMGADGFATIDRDAMAAELGVKSGSFKNAIARLRKSGLVTSISCNSSLFSTGAAGGPADAEAKRIASAVGWTETAVSTAGLSPSIAQQLSTLLGATGPALGRLLLNGVGLASDIIVERVECLTSQYGKAAVLAGYWASVAEMDVGGFAGQRLWRYLIKAVSSAVETEAAKKTAVDVMVAHVPVDNQVQVKEPAKPEPKIEIESFGHGITATADRVNHKDFWICVATARSAVAKSKPGLLDELQPDFVRSVCVSYAMTWVLELEAGRTPIDLRKNRAQIPHRIAGSIVAEQAKMKAHQAKLRMLETV
jgi:hypothetical protein